MSTVALRLYLVRHGETQENRDGIIQGQNDTELNELGIKQAKLLGDFLKDVTFSLVYTSDLKRAQDTLGAITRHHDHMEIVKVPDLRERAFGDLESKKFSTGMRLAISADNTVEPSSAFSKRLSTWWNEKILQSALSKTKEGEEINVLIVTHAGVIATLVRDLIGSRKLKPAEGVIAYKCPNASITIMEMEYGSSKGVLVRYGDVGHLEGLVVEDLEAEGDGS